RADLPINTGEATRSRFETLRHRSTGNVGRRESARPAAPAGPAPLRRSLSSVRTASDHQHESTGPRPLMLAGRGTTGPAGGLAHTYPTEGRIAAGGLSRPPVCVKPRPPLAQATPAGCRYRRHGRLNDHRGPVS